MYKIYINEIPIILVSTESFKQMTIDSSSDHLVGAYTGKPKSLLAYVDHCEKSTTLKQVVIHYPRLNKLIENFEGLFELNEAAGGLIVNDLNECLVMFRRGFWDLPKGKLEKKETKKEAALREVCEETGIQQVSLIKKITVTHHVFKNKSGTRILKRSHWYLMKSSKQLLVPQVEEDIEKVEWVSGNEFLNTYTPIYKNIVEVFNNHFN